MSEIRFEEKILYRTRQHWIVLCLKFLKLTGSIAIPVAFVVYFISDFSWLYTLITFFIIISLIFMYYYYLWSHSWLLIGNQKVTLLVRNGLFSQYAMNIRYRNIRDSAVSKNSIIGYILKFGTLFIRASSGSEGDFQAHFIPKVGKVYALVNALSRYDDDSRAHLDTIEKLHTHHIHQEFSPRKHSNE